MNQGGQISDLGNNQVEVWNARNSQEQAVHQGATIQESDQVDPEIDILTKRERKEAKPPQNGSSMPLDSLEN